jgi:hypothetical protein
VLAAVCALSTAACVKQLPPAPTPNAVAPPVDTNAAVPEGHGRLIVDVVDGPTPVRRVVMASQAFNDGNGDTRYRFSESPQPLCSTSPCVADLPVGNVLLMFPVEGKSTTEVELVHIGDAPTVYRRSLSVYDRKKKGATHVLGIIGASVGTVAAITGVVLLPIGLSDDNNDLATAGGITLAAGAVLVALGVWAIRRNSDTFRPGSSIHFPLGSP